MNQQQAAMLKEVQELREALRDTRHSQQVTRETVGKIIGFLHHMHGGARPGTPGMLTNGLQVGPQDGGSGVATRSKRPRLHVTDEETGQVTISEIPGSPEHRAPAGGNGAAHGAPQILPSPLLQPETLAESRRISKQLSNQDMDSIDIDSVLDLLNGIERDATAHGGEEGALPPAGSMF